jgi:hypothetical protein
MTDQNIGWWRFESDRTAMAHSMTGQSVRLLGRASPEPAVPFTNSGIRIWHRFQYEDRETTYPLLVEWRIGESRDSPNSIRDRLVGFRPAAFDEDIKGSLCLTY